MIIDDWDPIDLLSHAPSDEYYSEILSIYQLLNTIDDVNELSNGIYEIFVESFGKNIFNKTKEECIIIAEKLLSQQ